MNGPVSNEAGIVRLPEETVQVTRMISVPVTDSGKVVLLAGMYNKERAYNEDNLKQCTLLLSGLWGIIQRKRTEEELRQKNAELSDAHTEIARTRDKLQESVQKLASIAGSPDETETCLKLIADSIPAFISLHEISGAVRYANRHWTEQMDDTGNLHASWNLLVVPADRKKIHDAFSSRFGKITSFSLKYRIRTRDGRKIQIRAIFQPLIAKDETLSGYICSAAETGRK
jgi:PAS domain-containing protein